MNTITAEGEYPARRARLAGRNVPLRPMPAVIIPTPADARRDGMHGVSICYAHPGIHSRPERSPNGVYFVAETDRTDRRVKIGMTCSGRHSRFASLQQGCPSDLEMVVWVSCSDRSGHASTMALERQLHRHFADLRVRQNSEWFYVADDLAEFIAEPYDIPGLVIATKAERRQPIRSTPTRQETA